MRRGYLSLVFQMRDSAFSDFKTNPVGHESLWKVGKERISEICPLTWRLLLDSFKIIVPGFTT